MKKLTYLLALAGILFLTSCTNDTTEFSDEQETVNTESNESLSLSRVSNALRKHTWIKGNWNYNFDRRSSIVVIDNGEYVMYKNYYVGYRNGKVTLKIDGLPKYYVTRLAKDDIYLRLTSNNRSVRGFWKMNFEVNL